MRFVYNKLTINKGKKRKQQGRALLLVISAFFIVLICGFGVKDYLQSQIVINEICSDNESYVLDENEQIEDYIELYNAGSYDCSLDGLFLSDDVYELKKMSLEEYIIPAGELLIVPCVDSANSFAINNKGECIYLSNEDGKILEQVEVEELEEDTAYVRNITGIWQIGNCTPAMPNDIVTEVLVEQPILSHNSGFYDEAFELEISCREDTIIYYTLDGSTPDEGSYIYEGPIEVYDRSKEPNVGKSVKNVVREWQDYEPDTTPVAKAFLIRAIAMDNAGNKSDVVTATYFVGIEGYEQGNVISLVVQPKDLYGDEEGIYVTGETYDEWYLNGQQGDEPLPNFRQKGREWEREAVFELFENCESVFQQNVGVRIQGASGRGNVLKRFSVYARKEYNTSDVFEYPFFDNHVRSHSIVLRDSVADVICQELMSNRGIPHQRAKKVDLFLNGEFWYSCFLREKYNEQYFEDYYGIDKDNLIVIEGNTVTSGVETDMVQFHEFYDYLENNDFSDEAMYKELEEKLDIQSYIEFMAANIYCANMDIAFEKTKNVVMWRSREQDDTKYGDCKWRFGLYDMDNIEWFSNSYYEVEHCAEVNSFSQQPQFANTPYNQSELYLALRQNECFCKQFVLTFMDLLNENFRVENVNNVLQRYGESIEWADSFFEKRPQYVKTHLAEEFELTGSLETVTLRNEDENKGTIIINTIKPTMKNASWTGEYFTDFPVTVTAEPAEGYEFIGWSGSVVSNEMTIEVPVAKGGIDLKAEFQKIE